MIKLNNKGMSLVEVIVTFSLLLIIVIGLYNFILDVKTTLRDKEIIKNITDFSSLKNDQIQYNLITNKPFAIVIKKTSNDNFICATKDHCTMNTNSVSVSYNGRIKQLGTGSLSEDYCKKVYPCAVYFYNNKGEIGTVTIGLNNKNDNSKLGPGILYGKEKEVFFEKLPDSNYLIMHTKDKDNNKNVYIDFKNNMFILNYPYFLKDNINYGFKIAYPVLEE